MRLFLKRVTLLFFVAAVLPPLTLAKQPALSAPAQGGDIRFQVATYKGELQSRAEARPGILRARLRVNTLDGRKFTGMFRDEDALDVPYTGQGRMLAKGNFVFKGVFSPEGSKGTRVILDLNGFLSANSELAVGTYKLTGTVSGRQVSDYGNFSFVRKPAPPPQ